MEKLSKALATNGQIYCFRAGKIFKTSPDNIEQQNYFHKSNPINIDEINLANYYICIFDPEVKEPLSGLLKIYNITANTNDYLIKCGIEDFHGIVESNFIPVLAKLYEADLSFLGISKEKSDFSFFIGCQYSRTNNMRSRFITSKIAVPEKVDKENIAKIFSLSTSAIIANWIYSKAKLQFLNNKTSEPFITVDQPVFNLKGTESIEIALSEFELFYPISPLQAIIIAENNTQPLMVFEDVERVKWFNSKMWKNAKEKIYAKDEENLKII